MKAKQILMAIAVLPIVSMSAAAKDLPLVLRFDGTVPQSVVIFDSSGSRTEPVDAQRKSIASSLKLATEAPETHRMTIKYNGFGYPMDLRVHPFLPKVEFGVSMQPSGSCTAARVDKLEKPVTDFEEALRDSIEAKQLMAIEGNDRCLKSLRRRAAKVAYDKNVRANQLSKGLVAINEDLAVAYAQEFGSAAFVMAEIADYERQSIGLDAVQLVAVRDDARERGDFAIAATIQDVIAERAASDENVAKAFASENLDSERIKDDREFLRALANTEAEPQ